MLRGEPLIPPKHIYPPHEWKFIETRFHPDFLPETETLFALGNGYLGLRGNLDEGAPAHQNGTFINGFYETWPIVYPEEAYGFARTGQTIVNVTDSKIIKLYVDDEPLYLPAAHLIDFRRELDMQAGTLSREVTWETPSGKLVLIKSTRLVSLEYRHLAVISYEVTVLNATAPVVISSEMYVPQLEEVAGGDPRRTHGLRGKVLLPHLHAAQDQRLMLSHVTAKSGLNLTCGVEHTFSTECSYTWKSKISENAGKVFYNVEAQPGVPIKLVKFMAYHKSATQDPEELCERTEWSLDRAREQGFDRLLSGQREFLDSFWERSDVRLVMNKDKARFPTQQIQQWVRFNLFHLCQATARVENAGIPAKGLTGQGYEGHYFWDAEIYVMPFLTYTEPRLAKNLLKFRYGMLNSARKRAQEVNQKGALFPWRTINGEEASAYYAAGTAQVHINADIIYALRKYVQVTGDQDFLYREGAEMLVETARFWNDLGFYSEPKGGQFCIHGVTGPDEYTTVVDNNTYTNMMARENLYFAAVTVNRMKKEEPEKYRELVQNTDLKNSEIDEWLAASSAMHLVYDTEQGIHPQDDTFLTMQKWDFANTPPDKYPLLLHYHPLVIYRHQVVKQADVVLAMFLLGDEFSLEQKKRNFDFYDPITTGDSSLSVGIQSILASEVGYIEKAGKYAIYSVLMDISDLGGNVKDGCHIAAMGATWMIMVYGFAGMRDYQGLLSFSPYAVENIEQLQFCLQVRGRVLELTVRPESITYTLKRGTDLVFLHHDEKIRLSEEVPEAVRALESRT
jgi:alpha,alpha-trehalose phosphorylase